MSTLAVIGYNDIFKAEEVPPVRAQNMNLFAMYTIFVSTTLNCPS